MHPPSTAMTNYETLTLWQAVRRWPRAAGISVCMALNVLLWGYDQAIVGNVASMPVFQEVFGEKYEDRYIIPSIWLSLWSVAFPIGSMIGAAAGGWVQDLTGRKWTLGIGSVISVAAIFTCYISDRAARKQSAIFGGKLLEGVAVGLIICSTQTYLSEVVPARLRGPIFALFPAFQLLGQLVAAVVVLVVLPTPGAKSYRIALATEWPFSVIPLLLAALVPESPVWLLQKDKTQAARDCFRRFHGAQVATDSQDLFHDMHRAVNEERWAAQDRQATYIECFRGVNLKRSMIVVFANTIPELFGLTLIGHASYFLQILGLSHTISFIILVLGVVLGLFANIGSWWTLLKFGRRLLILSTLSIVGVLWLSIGIAGCFTSKNVAYYCAAGMMAIIGVGWLLGGVLNCGFGFGVPYLYNSDAGNLGGKVGFVFLGFAALGVLITWFTLPELKGLSAVEIDRVFEKHVPVRRANTAQWESLPQESNEDGVPLRQLSTAGSDGSAYDAGSVASGVGVVHVVPKEAYEPLRRAWKV
ncbi:hypothetical protein LTR53_000122 [Teratosphaeriaceae sp. CCFEE 6253]|nr:hypothetical protein LTR53_000122 [Teratosphaeriaceae sp. CCFEE 6253]